MTSMILRIIKNFWWVSLLIVPGYWVVYLIANCSKWPNGCIGFEGKTLWDVLELMIIPLTIAGVATYLDWIERKKDRENTIDNQREALLQDYIDAMTALILDKGLTKSSRKDAVGHLAQVKTQITYERLDPKRNEILVKFLGTYRLIQGEDEKPPIIYLDHINLQGAKLNRVDLKGAHIANANLSKVEMVKGDLESASLPNTNMAGARLSFVNFKRAYLEGINFESADLSCSSLDGACINFANIRGAILRRASLIGCVLEYSNLHGAKLKGAIMPDGKEFNPTIHRIEELTKQETSSIFHKFSEKVTRFVQKR